MQHNSIDAIDGRFWLSKDDQNFMGKGRIELLQQIGRTGSISKAAKAMKMSYKAAWDAIDAMNNLSEQPLVERSTGGRGGGGTRLTPYAEAMIETFAVLSEEHARFLHNLSLRVGSGEGHLRLIEKMSLQVSARNQLHGRVVRIHKGSVNSEVVLQLQGSDTVTAIITNDSLSALDIKIDSEVYALFKAGSVLLSSDLNLKLSTRNRFEGSVTRISRGSVNCEVILTLDGGNTLCATLTEAAFEELALEEGMRVLAFCKASNIILGL